MRVARSTGALGGGLIIVLGVWGALIPFIGPYFHYAFGNFDAWHYTANRLWLDIIPGAVAILGGVLLLTSARRETGLFAGWLAIAAGAWFAIGPAVSLLWHSAGNPIGAPMGGHIRRAAEWVGYFYGLGALIVAFAAFAMGRFFSRPATAVTAAAAPAATAAEAPVARDTAGAAATDPDAADTDAAATTAPAQRTGGRRRIGPFRRRTRTPA
jgi:hypothetical protein